MKERFPARGSSGHHATLELEIVHGLGERVLPGALQIQTQSDAVSTLEALGFRLPEITGPARPRVMRSEEGTTAKTRVQLSLVLLPKEPGRQTLNLPPLPIAMARASGEVITLCTQPHSIEVEDPTVDEPNAAPKPNPAPTRQLEFWEALRNAVYGGVLALALAALAFSLVRWFQRRPKVLPPPPPPRPAWEVALESFREIRAAKLVERELFDEHFDRVSHALRLYLGDRFHYDGLEATTSETLEHLKKTPEAHAILPEIEAFLGETDLVKFAKLSPTAAQCESLLDRSERVVRHTMPASVRSSQTAAEASLATGEPA